MYNISMITNYNIISKKRKKSLLYVNYIHLKLNYIAIFFSDSKM